MLIGGSYFQEHFDLVEGLGVDDILFAEPAFAGNTNTVVEELKVVGVVGVWIDRALHAFIASVFPPSPVHVEAVVAGIELDDGSCFRSAVDDFLVVDCVGSTLE